MLKRFVLFFLIFALGVPTHSGVKSAYGEDNYWGYISEVGEENTAEVALDETPEPSPIAEKENPADTAPAETVESQPTDEAKPDASAENEGDVDEGRAEKAPQGKAPNATDQPVNSDGDDFSIAPLLNVDENEAEDSKEVDVLGPFITSKKKEETREFGLRPLFYWLEDEEKNSAELDLLYPFATYDRKGADKSFQMFFYLMSYSSNERPSGFMEKKFTIFPILFAKKAEEKDKSYFALFPLYGRMKERFGKDEINFFLFPLFLETKKGESTNYSFLWPFFGYYKGAGMQGWRFWPIYGERKRGDVLDEKFFLWPIFVSKKIKFYGEERRQLSIFPLYLVSESPGRKQETFLWPFINHLVDKKKNIERWDVPWPLINITRGEKEQTRVFPFYSKKVMGNDEEGFFLWPIYKYKTIELEDNIQTRKRILLFLYSDIKEEPLIEGGRARRRIDLWPLFTYKKDTEGNRSFHLLSPIEPFVPGSQGIERNWASFWRLYEWNKYSDGSKTSSFLWNSYSMENNSEKKSIKLKPIIPIFSYKNIKEKDTKRYDLFGGLFRYKSRPHKKEFKLFFIPFEFERDQDEAVAEEDEAGDDVFSDSVEFGEPKEVLEK